MTFLNIFSRQCLRASHVLHTFTLSSSLLTPEAKILQAFSKPSDVCLKLHIYFDCLRCAVEAFKGAEAIFISHSVCVVLGPEKMMHCGVRCETYHICVRHWTKTGHIDVSLHFCYSVCGDKE